MKTQTKPKAPLRRRLVPTGTSNGVHGARIKSLTHIDGIVYDTRVDLALGGVRCNCADFNYRHARFEPTIHDTAHHCKHIARHIELCRRHDEVAIADARPCAKCGVADAEFEMCDDSGNVQIGWVCACCVRRSEVPR